MDTECGALVVSFLSLRERRELRAVNRRWLFTCTCLQFNDINGSEVQPRKSVWNLRSRAFRHAWTTFIRQTCYSFLPLILKMLPAATMMETMELKRGLCLSTNTGQRPSFGNTHARSGYNPTENQSVWKSAQSAADGRAQRATIGIVSSEPNRVLEHGAVWRRSGVRRYRTCLHARVFSSSVHATVYDNEPGWETAINAAGQTLDQLGQRNVSLNFRFCDITLDLGAVENKHVRQSLRTTQLHIFSFVCVENFCLLRNTDYVFLRSLFGKCSAGSYFIFTDSTHRLWPAIFDVANTIAPDRFRVWTPFTRSCHYALVLQKLPDYSKPASTYPFYTQAMQKLEDFHRHQQKHLETMQTDHSTVLASIEPN